MLIKIKSWFVSHSVDAVLLVLNKTVTRLKKVQEHHANEALSKGELVKQLSKEIEGHDKEALRAQRVTDKINELIS